MPGYDTLTPVRNWPEIHAPTLLKSKMIDEYVDSIQKEKTTTWFGLNIDFGVVQNITSAQRWDGRPGGQPIKEGTYSEPTPTILAVMTGIIPVA